MLVLSRKLQEEIMIGENVKITVLKVKGNTVRLGIEAPKSVRIVRGELPAKETPQQAEVTVVLSDLEPEFSKQEPADIVPFPKQNDPSPSETTLQKVADSRISSRSTPKMETNSISFQTRLPQSLEHNRLKQIVKEISSRQGSN